MSDSMNPEITLLPEEIEKLKKSGSIIPAIKAVVQRTGCGLIEAKTAVEREGRRLKMYQEGPCPRCNGTGRAPSWDIFHK